MCYMAVPVNAQVTASLTDSRQSRKALISHQVLRARVESVVLHRESFRLYDNTVAVSQKLHLICPELCHETKALHNRIEHDQHQVLLSGLECRNAGCRSACVHRRHFCERNSQRAMVVAAGDNDASRIRRLTALVNNQGPTCSWRCCCQKCRARNVSNESISCCRRSIGTWMAQPNFRQPVRPTRHVYLAQRGEAEELQGRASTSKLTYGIAAGSCLAGG